jgi:homoserine O-succinyltransferase/O-acetyltransferase
MSVLLEQGTTASGFLPAGASRVPVAMSRRGDIAIGIVNNMPDTALAATERQFVGLLAAASGRTPIRVKLFALPSVPRGAAAQRHIADNYAPIEDLWNGDFDGLIVTGTEPRGALAGEPYWADFARLVDWAEANTVSAVWSCLAAHAAVLHLDGIDRVPFVDKCFGVFECQRTADHALTAAMGAQLQVPHSRWNDLPERALTACGYDVLSRAPDIGADIFVKSFRSVFVFLQGHPEYEPSTLAREYRRDVGRYLRGERETYPAQPLRYFDSATSRALDVFRTEALASHSERRSVDAVEELFRSFPMTSVRPQLMECARACAARFYRNWLSCVAARRGEALRRAAGPAASKAAPAHIPNSAASV